MRLPNGRVAVRAQGGVRVTVAGQDGRPDRGHGRAPGRLHRHVPHRLRPGTGRGPPAGAGGAGVRPRVPRVPRGAERPALPHRLAGHTVPGRRTDVPFGSTVAPSTWNTAQPSQGRSEGWGTIGAGTSGIQYGYGVHRLRPGAGQDRRARPAPPVQPRPRRGPRLHPRQRHLQPVQPRPRRAVQPPSGARAATGSSTAATASGGPATPPRGTRPRRPSATSPAT